MTERLLPHSLEAERAVLGVITVRPEAAYIVGQVLKAEDFYRHAHRQIFAAMLALLERGVPPEFVTLTEELRKRGELDDVGGPAYVAGLSEGMPRSANVEYYARIVREKALLRSLIAVASRVADDAYAASDDARTVLDAAERSLVAISHEAIAGELELVERALPDTQRLLEAIAETGRPITGVETGWRKLDHCTRGLQPGNLIVLGGRPGEGKSAFALQLALHAARSGPVAFFSMEMSREELTTRALAQLAHVDHHAMMQGRLQAAELQAVGRAMGALGGLPLAIDDTAAQSPFQIRSKAKTLQARMGLALVVVDYLQLLQRPRTAHSREEAVAENTWGLKVLAGELKVPVLALSQLNRSSVKDERRPTLADLRESGAVEQHANVVLLLYRPPSETNGVVNTTPATELLVAKQRNGPSQLSIDLVFHGPSMRFQETEARYA